MPNKYDKLKELFEEFIDNIDSWVFFHDETMIDKYLESIENELKNIKGNERGES